MRELGQPGVIHAPFRPSTPLPPCRIDSIESIQAIRQGDALFGPGPNLAQRHWTVSWAWVSPIEWTGRKTSTNRLFTASMVQTKKVTEVPNGGPSTFGCG